MDALCDEIVHLIFCQLSDPGSLAHTSHRFLSISQDPYIRSRYFLTRYGSIQAMYHALGRGKILTDRVLDILLSSGAQMSRYLVQVAIHHYFYAQSHFVKTAWVRSIDLSVFSHFLKLASERYGEIPRGKGEDDGSVFTSFLKESRFPTNLRVITFERIRDILEKYKFIPFSPKDPIMVQFPLALAIEPRLLPFAVSNGFYMDSKYRDFVFRKIFERPPSGSDRSVQDIVDNVQELCRLDETMFLSRTVAAEVCMEAKANEVGYAALKQLNKSHALLFDLNDLVESLLKLFLKSNTITSTSNNQVLRHLFTDFPSSNATVRLVMLLTVFIPPEHSIATLAGITSRLAPLNMGPLTRSDLCNVLINPLMEKFNPLLEYMRTEAVMTDDGVRVMSQKEIRAVIEDVAARCVRLETKGKMLRKLYDMFPSVHEVLVKTVLQEHRIRLEDLPPSDNSSACAKYNPQLCRGFFKSIGEEEYFWESPSGSIDGTDRMDVEGLDASDSGDMSDDESADGSSPYLGHIGQESLTTMIRQDELMPARSRRRMFWSLGSLITSLSDRSSSDSTSVGRWVKDQFGARSGVTAVFMTHAVLNDNTAVLRYYLKDMLENNGVAHVPLTLRHFQLLAHLGRAPNYFLFQVIQAGAEFYRSEDEYISKHQSGRRLSSKVRVKMETTVESIPPLPIAAQRTKSHKRPRRSAAMSVRSYAVSSSDEEDDDHIGGPDPDDLDLKKRQKETHLQMWISALGDLSKAEEAKHREKKKQLDMNAEPGSRPRATKNDFFRSLQPALRIMRKQEQDRRPHNSSDFDANYNDDNDYSSKTKSKKRKIRA